MLVGIFSKEKQLIETETRLDERRIADKFWTDQVDEIRNQYAESIKNTAAKHKKEVEAVEKSLNKMTFMMMPKELEVGMKYHTACGGDGQDINISIMKIEVQQ